MGEAARIRRSQQLANACELLGLGLALTYAAVYLGVAWLSVGYEYPLEWIEGGVVDEVARAMAGRSLYAAPSLDYVAYVYTPLHCCPNVNRTDSAGYAFRDGRGRRQRA